MAKRILLRSSIFSVEQWTKVMVLATHAVIKRDSICSDNNRPYTVYYSIPAMGNPKQGMPPITICAHYNPLEGDKGQGKIEMSLQDCERLLIQLEPWALCKSCAGMLEPFKLGKIKYVGCWTWDKKPQENMLRCDEYKPRE